VPESRNEPGCITAPEPVWGSYSLQHCASTAYSTVIQCKLTSCRLTAGYSQYGSLIYTGYLEVCNYCCCYCHRSHQPPPSPTYLQLL